MSTQNHTGDLPTMSAMSHTHSTYGLGAMSYDAGANAAVAGWQPNQFQAQSDAEATAMLRSRRVAAQMLQHQPEASPAMAIPTSTLIPQDRLVRVIIADTNKSIPQDKRILHKSEEFYTDSTDQELFHEVDVMALLRKHNEYRTTLLDKATDGTSKTNRNLEPARVRDLHMAVVTVAMF